MGLRDREGKESMEGRKEGSRHGGREWREGMGLGDREGKESMEGRKEGKRQGRKK